MPIPSAPPEPPSPITTQTIGVRIWLMAIRFSAMISGLAALLGGDAGVGTGVSMNEMIGRPNFAASRIFQKRLAITLGMGTAEVALLALGQVFSLLVADEHHLLVVEVSQAGDDGLVVAEGAITVQLEELFEDQVDVVASLGPLLVP